MRDQESGQHAVLLYDEHPEISFKDILAKLNTAIGDLKIRFRAAPLSSECFALFTHDRMQLTLAVNLAPIKPGVLTTALSAPLNRLKKFDFHGAVSRHRRSIRISLTDAPQPGPDGPDNADDISVRLLVLHRALLTLMDASRPTLVHWGQSDMLFTPEEVDTTRDAGFPSALVLHPLPLDGEDERAPGLRAAGSELFCGRTLVVEPGSMPTAAAIAVCERMIEQAVIDNQPLPDGSTLPFRPGTQLRVAHSDGPEDVILITVELKAAHVPPLPPVDDLVRAKATKAARDRANRRSRRKHWWSLPEDENRSTAWRTYALCGGIALMTPVAAILIAGWNVYRGPNIHATAGAFVLVLSFYVGSAAIDLAQSMNALTAEMTATAAQF